MEYNVTIKCSILKQDGTVFYNGVNEFVGVDEDAAKFFDKAAADLDAHASKSKGQSGKTYTVSAGTGIVGTDGTVLRDGAVKAYPGVPYEAILKAEEKLLQLGMDLGVRGKAIHAKKKK